MWKTFALPRLLYGLSISKLRHSDTIQLETLQRSVLRRPQCLPNNTADVAEYRLLGVRPVEKEIDFRKSLCSYPSYIVTTAHLYNAMHACIYVQITIRLFPVFYISYMFRGPYGRLAVKLNMSPS